MITWTVKDGKMDIHEVVISEIFSSQGIFTVDDVRRRIAKRIQPYMKDFTPKQNVENCRNLNEMLAYLMKSFLFSHRIRYVDECHFVFE